jgi:hypothetical protein
MRRALLLSVVLASGCSKASPPPVASGPNVVKANKEMSDLFRKADALGASNTAPSAAAPQPVVPQAVPPPPAPPANPPAPPPASQQATPAKSKADTTRDQAAAAFGDRLRTLRRTAEAARLKKDRYLQVCQGPNASLKSECQLLTTDLADASKAVERELGDIEEAARRAQIDPGVMHDLLAKYGF